jgi:hypothetical protein
MMASVDTLTNEEPKSSQATDALPQDSSEKTQHDVEPAGFPEWQHDPENPLNWPTWRKTILAVVLGLQAFTA